MSEPTRQHAIVHEWVSSRSGSEKVFEAIAQLDPSADLWALTADPTVALEIGDRPVRTTVLDRPVFRDRRHLTLPLMPFAWQMVRPSKKYDLVISSHHAFAKSFRPARACPHYCYVHTPARYVWTPDLDDRGRRRSAQMLRPVLKRVDRLSVDHVDSYAANSTNVARRIEEFWDRTAVVIPPPVDTTFYSPGDVTGLSGFVLSAGRFVEYKRHDLAIRAAAACGLPIVLAGAGPDEARLREVAQSCGARATFVIGPTDIQLRDLYRGAMALLYLGIEDFGIIPVEAMACGTPVVGLAAGGCAETVVHQRTGWLVDDAEVGQLAGAVEAAAAMTTADCRERAAQFSYAAFAERIHAWVPQLGTPTE